MTSRTLTIWWSYSSGRLSLSSWSLKSVTLGTGPAMVDARFREKRFIAAWLVRRKRPGRATAGWGSAAASLSGLVRSDGSWVAGLWSVLTSVNGTMGVATRERAMGGGDDHRPGRGSELLRRRFPRQASSSTSGCGVCLLLSLTAEVTLSSAAVLRCSGGGGDRWCCCSCWFESSPLLLKEETEDKRWMRTLGRRARDRVRCRWRLGCAGTSAAAGVKWEESVVVSPVPAGRSSGPRTGSMRSIEGEPERTRDSKQKKRVKIPNQDIYGKREVGGLEGEKMEGSWKKKKRGEGKLN